MKTFDDLEFKDRYPRDDSAALAIIPEMATFRQARLDFDSGWGVSVLTGWGSYGGDKGLYELAVFYEGSLHYSNPVAGGDVCGHLTKEQVTDLMAVVQEYADEPEVVAGYDAANEDDS